MLLKAPDFLGVASRCVQFVANLKPILAVERVDPASPRRLAPNKKPPVQL